MVFASLTYIYIFLPMFFIVYFLYRKNILIKNIVICFFSLIFYAWGEPVYILLLIFSVWFNFLCGKKMGELDKEGNKFFIVGIVFNVLMLVVFKYTNLFIEIMNLTLKDKINFYMPLPIGISFYTFQAMSYLIDVHKKNVKYQKNFINLLLYISMFPQLIAGPIVRYNDINKLLVKRTETIDKVYDGIIRAIIGLSKKILLANQLSIVVESLLSNNRTIVGCFLGILLFLLQLYYDFSGYSDIAIGIGKIIGFEFLENFDYPLLSVSMTEFWRKWHISLGSFFRDYVYIPLGGNKKNQFINIFIVWLLTGIWHGASVNFLFWGIFLAIVIILEKILNNIFNKKNVNKFNLFMRVFGHIYFIIISFISFTLFYFDDIYELKDFVLQFFTYSFFDYETESIIINNLNLLLICFVCIFPILKIYNGYIIKKSNKFCDVLKVINMILCIVLLIVSTLFLIGGTNNPFLYFRF